MILRAKPRLLKTRLAAVTVLSKKKSPPTQALTGFLTLTATTESGKYFLEITNIRDSLLSKESALVLSSGF